jgi:hypothetical protein
MVSAGRVGLGRVGGGLPLLGFIPPTARGGPRIPNCRVEGFYSSGPKTTKPCNFTTARGGPGAHGWTAGCEALRAFEEAGGACPAPQPPFCSAPSYPPGHSPTRLHSCSSSTRRRAQSLLDKQHAMERRMAVVRAGVAQVGRGVGARELHTVRSPDHVALCSPRTGHPGRPGEAGT